MPASTRSTTRSRTGRSRAAAAPGAAAPPRADACGCAAVPSAGARTAVGVDRDAKARNVRRLRRIEGQVRGVQKMVEDERYCADILVQLASVQQALRAVGRELMRNHLRHCASAALRGTPQDAEAMRDELLALMERHAF